MELAWGPGEFVWLLLEAGLSCRDKGRVGRGLVSYGEASCMEGTWDVEDELRW